MDQGVISILKSYYLRNTFCKATAITDSSDVCAQSKLKTLWKGLTILCSIKHIQYAAGTVKKKKKNSNVIIWESITPNKSYDFSSNLTYHPFR